MLDVGCFRSQQGPVAQRLEQGTHNSRKSFCARFLQRCTALLKLGISVVRHSRRLARIARFAPTNSATVETTVKIFVEVPPRPSGARGAVRGFGGITRKGN